eukprot:6322238-Prymnesium_polylepis.1
MIPAGIQRFQSTHLSDLRCWLVVASDARCDDHAGRNPELLPGQVDRLCRLGTAQLIDGERTPVNGAQDKSMADQARRSRRVSSGFTGGPLPASCRPRFSGSCSQCSKVQKVRWSIQIRQVHTGGYPVGHVGWNASSPDALDVALGQGVADGIDRFESELTGAVLVDTAELVGVQAVKRHTFRMGWHILVGP